MGVWVAVADCPENDPEFRWVVVGNKERFQVKGRGKGKSHMYPECTRHDRRSSLAANKLGRPKKLANHITVSCCTPRVATLALPAPGTFAAGAAVAQTATGGEATGTVKAAVTGAATVEVNVASGSPAFDTSAAATIAGGDVGTPSAVATADEGAVSRPGCRSAVTFELARRHCAAQDPPLALCSKARLEDAAFQADDNVCRFDAMMTWTDTPCVHGGHREIWVGHPSKFEVHKSGRKEPECASVYSVASVASNKRKNKLQVTCCDADNKPSRPRLK